MQYPLKVEMVHMLYFSSSSVSGGHSERSCGLHNSASTNYLSSRTEA